jgi:bifunctional DNase/RNase
MDLIKLNIVGLSYSQFKSGAYALFLENENAERRISIVIGACEAQSIAISLDKTIVSPRPLTHDLFLSLANNNNLTLDKVIIHKLEKGIFFSSMLFVKESSNESFMIDSRTSDAIALAIRFNSPIYTSEEILNKADNYFKDNIKSEELNYEVDEDDEKKSASREELENKLEMAISSEQYELAAKIRDQISKMK